MVDVVTQEVRSRMMSGIRGRDTKPEIALRRALHARGFRFRIHVKGMPGKPDMVFPKWGAALFVHGCYWHRHQGCSKATTPSSNARFWQEKFAGNVSRDERNVELLIAEGWRVGVVWECCIGKLPDDGTVDEVAGFLRDRIRAIAEWP